MIARQESVDVLGQQFILQSVSPIWYYQTNDMCGMTGDRKDTGRYMDLMFKNCVVAPAELAAKGLRYFDERGDIDTPEHLLNRIEKFLRPGARQDGGAQAGQAAPGFLDAGV